MTAAMGRRWLNAATMNVLEAARVQAALSAGYAQLESLTFLAPECLQT